MPVRSVCMVFHREEPEVRMGDRYPEALDTCGLASLCLGGRLGTRLRWVQPVVGRNFLA